MQESYVALSQAYRVHLLEHIQRVNVCGRRIQGLILFSRSLMAVPVFALRTPCSLPFKTAYPAEKWEVELFWNIYMTWHLAELLYLSVQPGESILPSLLEWIELGMPGLERCR